MFIRDNNTIGFKYTDDYLNDYKFSTHERDYYKMIYYKNSLFKLRKGWNHVMIYIDNQTYSMNTINKNGKIIKFKLNNDDQILYRIADTSSCYPHGPYIMCSRTYNSGEYFNVAIDQWWHVRDWTTDFNIKFYDTGFSIKNISFYNQRITNNDITNIFNSCSNLNCSQLQKCNLFTGNCRECNNNHDCSEIQICTKNYFCASCEEDEYYVNNKCVECERNYDCDNNYCSKNGICSNCRNQYYNKHSRKCTNCISNNDCPNDINCTSNGYCHNCPSYKNSYNEELDECIECETNINCHDIDHRYPLCKNNICISCENNTYYDIESRECHECLNNTHCINKICNNNKICENCPPNKPYYNNFNCYECLHDDQCNNNEKCNNGQCNSCKRGLIYNDDTKECLTCFNDSHCNDPLKPRCSNNECVGCIGTSLNGRCVDCITNDDCQTYENPICSINNTCISCPSTKPKYSNNSCMSCGDKLYDIKNNICVDCLTNNDCLLGLCGPNKKCVECITDIDCAKGICTDNYICQVEKVDFLKYLPIGLGLVLILIILFFFMV